MVKKVKIGGWKKSVLFRLDEMIIVIVGSLVI